MVCLLYKIILTRMPGIGKVIDHIVNKRFKEDYKSTVGVEILTKDVEFEEERCNLSYFL